MIQRILNKVLNTCWKYKLYHSDVRVDSSSKMQVERQSQIRNSNIFLGKNARLIIGSHCILENIQLYVENGTVVLEDYSILKGASSCLKSIYTLTNGSFTMRHHSKSQCQRVWIRFGGKVEIGCYTNVNEGSEIRSDESVTIGSYNQISYHVNIWDTNTHTIYDFEKRAELTRNYYPSYGYEYEKPRTDPVQIGDHCWIGEHSSILKGSEIGNNVIIGYNTMLTNKTIESNKKVVQEVNIRIL